MPSIPQLLQVSCAQLSNSLMTSLSFIAFSIVVPSHHTSHYWQHGDLSDSKKVQPWWWPVVFLHTILAWTRTQVHQHVGWNHLIGCPGPSSRLNHKYLVLPKHCGSDILAEHFGNCRHLLLRIIIQSSTRGWNAVCFRISELHSQSTANKDRYARAGSSTYIYNVWKCGWSIAKLH